MRARVVEVNAAAKQEIKCFFMDPYEQMMEHFKKVGTVVSFQKKHLRSTLDKLGQMVILS